LNRFKPDEFPFRPMEGQMDPLLAAAAYSTTAATLSRKRRKDEDSFYERHGARGFRRAFPAAPAVATALALVVVVGLIG